MNYFEVFKYNDNLYQLKDKLGVLTTLVIGKEKALLFDTAYGIGNLKEEVEAITKLPLIVVNSHGHMDHACGNYQFDKVYIHEKDVELCKKNNTPLWRERNYNSALRANVNLENFDKENYFKQGEGNLEMLNYGDTFDLGDLHLEVIPMPGHTKGSIGLNVKEWKLLLVGDATCPFVWLFLEESEPLSVYVKMLEETLKLDFDNFLVGHGARLFPRLKMVDFYNIAKYAEIDKAVPVTFGPGFDHLQPYCYTKGKMYDQNDCGIVFDKNKL